MTDLSQCRAGGHRLVVIARNGSEMEEEVVRWCSVCGSVVVDIDFDGRTNPGARMTMRTPVVTRALTLPVNPATL